MNINKNKIRMILLTLFLMFTIVNPVFAESENIFSKIQEDGKGEVTATYDATNNKVVISGIGTIDRYKYFEFFLHVNEFLKDKNIKELSLVKIEGDQEGSQISLPSNSSRFFRYIVHIGDSSSIKTAQLDLPDNLDTSGVRNMSGMFAEAKSPVINVSNFDTSNVTDMSNMFFNTIAPLDVSNFNTHNVRNMSGMFAQAKSPVINVSNFDTSNVTDMSWMFHDTVAPLDVFNFKTNNVINIEYMFAQAKSPVINVSNFDTSNVTDMSNIFSNTIAPLDVSNFKTHNITNMSGMFDRAKSPVINVSNFDTSNVTDMSWMFHDTVAPLDVSNFKTHNVTNMLGMFDRAKSPVINVSNFDTSNVTDMSWMFYDTVAPLDVFNFKTHNVTNMEYMFARAKSSVIDVSKFDTFKAEHMKSMFEDSYANKLDLSSFSFSSDLSVITNMLGLPLSNEKNREVILTKKQYDEIKSNSKLSLGIFIDDSALINAYVNNNSVVEDISKEEKDFLINSKVIFDKYPMDKIAFRTTSRILINGGTSDKQTAAKNEIVTITADIPPADKEFDKWIVKEGNVNLQDTTNSIISFKMGEENIVISATYRDKTVALPSFVSYIIIEGNGQTVYKGASAKFKSDAPYSKLKEVVIDDKVVNLDNYIASEGSTTVELTADYVKTLTLGEHAISIVSTDGKASGKFIVTKKASGNINQGESDKKILPHTGEKISIMFYLILLLVSGCGFSILGFRRKHIKS